MQNDRMKPQSLHRNECLKCPARETLSYRFQNAMASVWAIVNNVVTRMASNCLIFTGGQGIQSEFIIVMTLSNVFRSCLSIMEHTNNAAMFALLQAVK